MWKVGAERGEGDFAEPAQDKRFGFIERLAERGVDRLLDKAARRLGAVADRQKLGLAKRIVDVAERDRAEIACDRPATAMALFGVDIAPVAQAPKILRITTGLVLMARASASEVTGPGCSAMCSRT